MHTIHRVMLTSYSPGTFERWVAAFLGVSGLLWAIPAFVLLPLFFVGFIFWIGRICIAFGDRHLNTPLFWLTGIVWELAIYLGLGGRYDIQNITSNYLSFHSVAAVSLSVGIIAVLISRRCEAEQSCA